MITTAYQLVFFGLLAIIPALIVAVIAMLRIESMRVAIVTMQHDVSTAKADVVALRTTITNVGASQEIDVKRISDLDAMTHNLKCKLINIEESITSLSNKFNSRERVDKRAIRREEEEKERISETTTENIPGTEQQILPLFQPLNAHTAVPRRRFGTMP